jgi:signal transduction histidine kinase
VAASKVSADYSVSLLDSPATLQQRRLVFLVAILLLVGLVIAAPFGNVPLRPFPAAVIAQQAIVFVNEFITALLLFAQYSIVRSRGVMALAGSYLFTALIVIAHGLTFPNAFTPSGLLGAGLQSTAWLYFFWHWGPPLGILAYACLKDVGRAKSVKQSSTAAIGLCVVVVLSLVGGLTWLATGGERFLPIIFADRTGAAPMRLAILTALTFVIAAVPLAVLLTRRSSVLDYWLMLVLWTLMLEQTLVGIFTDVRYSVGFYAGRGFSLLTSVFVLSLLLQEMIRLYARLARSNAMLLREQNNRLMTLEALAASISHEVRQPLTAMVVGGSALLRYLKSTPPKPDKALSTAEGMIAAGHRAGQILDDIRNLFGAAERAQSPVDVNDLVVSSLRALDSELKSHNVTTRIQLASQLPPIMGHRGQLQEVMVNLIQNAVDAMVSADNDRRVLQARTEHNGDAICVEIEDTGPGLDPKKSDNIFDVFFTTKPNGMGLGLAICRMIVERHEGRLAASSANPHGAIFRIMLPQIKSSR